MTVSPITCYAEVDKIEGGFRVIKMVFNAEENIRAVEFIIEVEHIDQIAFYEEFDDVHHVAEKPCSHNLIETDALSLAEALEATI